MRPQFCEFGDSPESEVKFVREFQILGAGSPRTDVELSLPLLHCGVRTASQTELRTTKKTRKLVNHHGLSIDFCETDRSQDLEKRGGHK
jgi:hypothetical protein